MIIGALAHLSGTSLGPSEELQVYCNTVRGRPRMFCYANAVLVLGNKAMAFLVYRRGELP